MVLRSVLGDIEPLHPYDYLFHLHQAYFILKQYDDAIAAIQEALV